jgi:hypothetical protein
MIITAILEGIALDVELAFLTTGYTMVGVMVVLFVAVGLILTLE